jgi:futalosine hydrolase
MKKHETLLLVPTALEAAGLDAFLIGFGPVLAGIRTARLLAEHEPRRVVLAGIAGSYRPRRLPVGAVLQATEVRFEGVGRGQGASFRRAQALGFSSGGDRIALPGRQLRGTVRGGLLTVFRSSANAQEARKRAGGRSDLLAEDMEAYSVALACREADVPLTVLRAVSNVVGEPKRAWRIPEALDALRIVLRMT